MGSQNALIYDRKNAHLFGVNAGDDTIFCIEIQSHQQKMRSLEHSGGTFPVSLALHGKTLYVLNAGSLGSVVAFRVKENCQLVLLHSSWDTLASVRSGFDLAFMSPNPVEIMTSASQVGVSPDGRKLVVSCKGGPPTFGGAIIVYDLHATSRRIQRLSRVDTLFGPTTNDAGPAGFSWAGNGDLLVNHMQSSTVAAYRINNDNTLSRTSGPVSVNTADDSVDSTGGMFNAWSAVHVVGGETRLYVSMYGHVPATNGGDPDGPGQIELFKYDHRSHQLTRVGNVATYEQLGGVGNHGVDLLVVARKSLSFLYALEPRFGRIAVYDILADGTLDLIQFVGVGASSGVDPYAGTNPGIVNFSDRCFLDGTKSPECDFRSLQGIVGY